MFTPTSTDPADQFVEILSFYEGKTLIVCIDVNGGLSTEFVIPKMLVATSEIEEFSNFFEIQSDSTGDQPSMSLQKDRVVNIKRITHADDDEVVWKKAAFEIKYIDGIVITVYVLD